MDTRKGEQHQPDFLAINPNGKVPVIIDQDTGARVFDSNAFLLYLGDGTGQFLPDSTPVARGELLSWLMLIATGIAPFSGQAVHFKNFAPEPKDYAVNRYLYEAKRHYGIIDAHLSRQRYMVRETYTIVDMALWGWARMVPFILGENAWDDFPNLKRLFDQISARLAAQTAAALKERHSFKPEMDDEVATICSDIWLPRPADISRVPPSLRSASKTAARQR